jgi:nucleotide-binding universal stress UspA family protein
MTQPSALVALDGSETAEAVLPWAAELARGLGLRLILLQMVEPSLPSPDIPNSDRVPAAETYLDGVAEPLRRPGIEVQRRAVTVEEGGDAVSAGIITQADLVGAALIMLATHGRSGPKRWALGSVAEEVIRTATCPVLVVRAGMGAPKDRPHRVQRILTPLDGSATAESALAEAVRLATAFGAILDVIAVVPWAASVYGAGAEVWTGEEVDDRLAQGSDDYLGRIQDRLPPDLPCERQVLRGAPATAILDHAERTRADLIVMGTHGRSGLSRFVLGSVADRVVRGGTVPVVLVRGGEAGDRGGANA